MQKIIVATGIPEYDNNIKKIEGYEYVNINIGFKSELKEACIIFKPNILIISEKLSGDEILPGIAIDIKQTMPNIRIIYLAGHVDLNNINKINKLGVMVMAGIYDIITEKKINKSMISYILETPKPKEEVEYLLRNFIDKKKEQDVNMEYEDEIEEEIVDDYYKNVFMISSIKPGTGKSFVSTNIATCLAKFGNTIDGNPPKIAIIEADLQTLSLGTLLAIEDDDKCNLKTVMNKISTVVTPDGKISKDNIRLNEVNEYILEAFKPYDKCKNLFALVGSQLLMEDMEGISPYYYSYLIDVVSRNYDYVIIDSNSSLVHVTTYPLLSIVNKCFYVLNLDFNNVRNNIRYRHTLKDIGVYDKVRFVLNEDLTDNVDNVEKLQFDSNMLEDSFDLVAKIPALPKVVFLNRLWQGVPIILDDTEHTLKARYEISKVANMIHPISNLSSLEKEIGLLKGKGNSKPKKKGFLNF